MGRYEYPMSLRSTFIYIIVFAMIGCASTQTKQTIETVRAKSSTWNDYTSHKMELNSKGSAVQFSYLLNPYSAKLEMMDGLKTIRAVRMGNAGIFYQGIEVGNCKPDTIEWLGLLGNKTLFLLNQAFPDGPESIGQSESITLTNTNKIYKVGYMSATMKWQPMWTANIGASRHLDGTVTYQILLESNDSQTEINGVWSNHKNTPVVNDSTLLSEWTTCWNGVFSTQKDGKRNFKSFIDNTDTFLTFGDILSVLQGTHNKPFKQDK